LINFSRGGGQKKERKKKKRKKKAEDGTQEPLLFRNRLYKQLTTSNTFKAKQKN
jgi:hypothetical protein